MIPWRAALRFAVCAGMLLGCWSALAQETEPGAWLQDQMLQAPFVVAPEEEPADDDEASITFGNDTDAFAETVKVRYGERSVCTGVLIDPGHILTAGHCGCARRSTYSVEFTLLKEDALHRFRGPIAAPPILYRSFDCARAAGEQPGRDLALLTIDIERDFRSTDGQAVSIAELTAGGELGARPVAMTSMLVVYMTNAVRLRAVGYGKTEAGDFPVRRQLADINILSYFCSTGRAARSACASFREFSLSNVIVPGVKPTDTCSGDSGGPIFVARPEEAGPPAYALVGITSRGLAGVQNLPGVPCGGGGIYTAVGHSDVARWLADNGAQATFK